MSIPGFPKVYIKVYSLKRLLMQITKCYSKPSKTVSRISEDLKNTMAQIHHPFLMLKFTEVPQCWLLLGWQYVFLYIFNCTYLQIACTSSSHLGTTGNQCSICELVLVKLGMITFMQIGSGKISFSMLYYSIRARRQPWRQPTCSSLSGPK